MKKGPIAICAVLALTAGCSSQAPQNYAVTYKVTGMFRDQSASVTYTDGSGDTEQIGNVSMPYSMSFKTSSCGTLVLSAQSHDENADLGVAIQINGITVKRAHSRGDYVVASAAVNPCN